MTLLVWSVAISVDAWLQEMGKAAVAITTTHTTSSSTSSSPMPAPCFDGLRTICILVKSSAIHLQQEHKKNNRGTHTSKLAEEGDHDSLAARIYLQTLAVRGQLALHPPAYTRTQTQTQTLKLSSPLVTTHKLKQETAVKKITGALSKHKAAAKHIPNWAMRLLLVVGSLLRQLGKTHEAVASLEAHTYELVIGKEEAQKKMEGDSDDDMTAEGESEKESESGSEWVCACLELDQSLLALTHGWMYSDRHTHTRFDKTQYEWGKLIGG